MSRLAAVQEHLSTVDQLLAELGRVAAETDSPRPSLLANIRALEKQRRALHEEFSRAAAAASLDVYRYSILNRDRATLTGLTAAWRAFQHMLSVVYDSMRSGGPPAKKAKARDPQADTIELGFGYSFAGSVGVALTLPNRPNALLWSDDTIARATDAVIEMAKSYNNHDRVIALARKLGPAPVEAMYRWVDVHVDHGYGVRLEWRRDESNVRDVLIQLEEFEKLRTEISRTTFETKITVSGLLEAVDTTEQSFRLRGDDGQVISGEYEDAITEDHKATLPARYTAEIVKVTRVVVVGGETKEETFILNSLQPL